MKVEVWVWRRLWSWGGSSGVISLSVSVQAPRPGRATAWARQSLATVNVPLSLVIMVDEDLDTPAESARVGDLRAPAGRKTSGLDARFLRFVENHKVGRKLSLQSAAFSAPARSVTCRHHGLKSTQGAFDDRAARWIRSVDFQREVVALDCRAFLQGMSDFAGNGSGILASSFEGVRRSTGAMTGGKLRYMVFISNGRRTRCAWPMVRCVGDWWTLP